MQPLENYNKKASKLALEKLADLLVTLKTFKLCESLKSAAIRYCVESIHLLGCLYSGGGNLPCFFY